MYRWVDITGEVCTRCVWGWVNTGSCGHLEGQTDWLCLVIQDTVHMTISIEVTKCFSHIECKLPGSAGVLHVAGTAVTQSECCWVHIGRCGHQEEQIHDLCGAVARGSVYKTCVLLGT